MTKLNISRWHIIGLAAVLLIGCLLIAVGSTFARYRTDYTGNTIFEANVPAEVAVGSWDGETETFTKDSELVWTETEEGLQLDFAVSNGSSSENQTVRVRMIASLNAWSEESDEKCVVISDGSEEKYTMQPERIGENTSMYYTFGDGWVFRFFDEDGKEARWLLKGGELSVEDMDISIEGNVITDVSLIQLQIDTDFEN